MSELWKRRFESEMHDKWCYAIIDRLASFDGSYVSNTIEFKKRVRDLKSIDALPKVYKALLEMGAHIPVATEFKDLLKRKVPFELWPQKSSPRKTMKLPK